MPRPFDDGPGRPCRAAKPENAAEKLGGCGTGGQQVAAADVRLAAGTRLSAPRSQRNPRPLGQILQRLAELHLVKLLNEGEHIPARLAHEAMENALCRDDAHRGSVVIVERAQPGILPPLGLERHVLADQARDVGRVLDAVLVAVVIEDTRLCLPESAHVAHLCLSAPSTRGVRNSHSRNVSDDPAAPVVSNATIDLRFRTSARPRTAPRPCLS